MGRMKPSNEVLGLHSAGEFLPFPNNGNGTKEIVVERRWQQLMPTVAALMCNTAAAAGDTERSHAQAWRSMAFMGNFWRMFIYDSVTWELWETCCLQSTAATALCHPCVECQSFAVVAWCVLCCAVLCCAMMDSSFCFRIAQHAPAVLHGATTLTTVFGFAIGVGLHWSTTYTHTRRSAHRFTVRMDNEHFQLNKSTAHCHCHCHCHC